MRKRSQCDSLECETRKACYMTKEQYRHGASQGGCAKSSVMTRHERDEPKTSSRGTTGYYEDTGGAIRWTWAKHWGDIEARQGQ
jgi:hypothetical protein